MTVFLVRLPALAVAACALLALADLPPTRGLVAPQANAATAATPAAIAEYRRKLKEYLAARDAFDVEATAYWGDISAKRRIRNAKRRNREQIVLDDYVLTQPPVYSGPKRPVNPLSEAEPERPRKPPRPIPIVADLLRAAAEQFQFVPERGNELVFKRAYASFAKAEGLTREQAVRVYAFETGGNGNYDAQSGLIGRPNGRPISSAIGYNQLLTTNSIELVAEQGHRLLDALDAKGARSSGVPRKALEQKIMVLKRMVAFCRSVPDDWSEHDRLADTAQGWAVHAMVLDIDVGPMLQTHKLMTSVLFAQQKGYEAPLTAAELEMMNLTGDGTGLDMVTMPPAMREQVPTSNFFQRSGYERNPVASRNNTVAKLLAVTDVRMDSNSQGQGARDLAAVF